MTAADKRKWDDIYARSETKDLAPVRVLSDHAHLLPAAGDALDLACGKGANGIFLAENGLNTRAWDISRVATQQLTGRAKELGVSMTVEQRDVVSWPPPPDSFDVLVVSRFLDRTIMQQINGALRDKGLLFYQTFILEKVSGAGPDNPDYRLKENELLQFFPQLHIIYYHEEGTVGNAREGFRNEAMLIAQKRS